MLQQRVHLLEFSIQNLQAVFFDFDGVLVDSIGLKTKAYIEIFQPYGKQAVDEIKYYHKKYGGIDRYRKITHVSGKLQLSLSETQIR